LRTVERSTSGRADHDGLRRGLTIDLLFAALRCSRPASLASTVAEELVRLRARPTLLYDALRDAQAAGRIQELTALRMRVKIDPVRTFEDEALLDEHADPVKRHRAASWLLEYHGWNIVHAMVVRDG
jgi:hypothetical protein